jgi:CheY-like chemotaxis protein
VLEAMRRTEAWRDVPVVIVTAKDLTREELDWLRTNAERVVHKGAYDRQELIAAVHDMIARGVPAPGEPGAELSGTTAPAARVDDGAPAA